MRMGSSLQAESGEEGGEKDKHCQNRNEVHQYLVTVVLYPEVLLAER